MGREVGCQGEPPAAPRRERPHGRGARGPHLVEHGALGRDALSRGAILEAAEVAEQGIVGAALDGQGALCRSRQHELRVEGAHVGREQTEPLQPCLGEHDGVQGARRHGQQSGRHVAAKRHDPKIRPSPQQGGRPPGRRRAHRGSRTQPVERQPATGHEDVTDPGADRHGGHRQSRDRRRRQVLEAVDDHVDPPVEQRVPESRHERPRPGERVEGDARVVPLGADDDGVDGPSPGDQPVGHPAGLGSGQRAPPRAQPDHVGTSTSMPKSVCSAFR